jgi:hypothetical protein
MLYPLSYGGSVAAARYGRATAPTVVRSRTVLALTVPRRLMPCRNGGPRASVPHRGCWAR